MDVKKYAKIFKALSNPNRLELFLGIATGNKKKFKHVYDIKIDAAEKYICEFQHMFATIGAPTISHHIKELANAELITTERRGKHLVASVNQDTWHMLSIFFSED